MEAIHTCLKLVPNTDEGFVEMIGIGESCIQSNDLQRGIRLDELSLGTLNAKTANLVGNCPTQRFFKRLSSIPLEVATARATSFTRII